MITLKKKHPAKVPYMLHTKMGDYVESEMDATIAEELLQRSKKVYKGEDKGYELVTDDETMFPIACFDFEDGDIRPMPRRKKARRLPTKEELVAEAAENMTNPQLYRAVKEAEAENEAKRAERMEKRAAAKEPKRPDGAEDASDATGE